MHSEGTADEPETGFDGDPGDGRRAVGPRPFGVGQGAGSGVGRGADRGAVPSGEHGRVSGTGDGGGSAAEDRAGSADWAGSGAGSGPHALGDVSGVEPLGGSTGPVSSGEVPDPEPELRPHVVIADRYELRRQLGRGGMGVVWEALDRRLGRRVAVKGLLYRGALEPETQAQWVERARREAQAIARIGHQNVVAVHDVIESGNQVWIVMELLDARSLADLLREQRRLPVAQAARIALQVLRGLRAAHEAGVLHRDVKPHNILFRPNGRALLMDFGIATFEGAVQLTKSQEIIGTPKYLAPELVHRGGEALPKPGTSASDLWSLGVTLFEMVEGRAPFTGLSSYEIFLAVYEQPLPAMTYAGPLAPVIEALLRKDPHERPDARRAEAMLLAVTSDAPAPHDATHRHHLGPPPEGGDDDSDDGRGSGGHGADTGGRGGAGGGRVPGGRRPRRRAVLRAAAVGCAVLLAGGGWLTWQHWGAQAPTYRHAHPQLKIGVKEDQPGLSQRQTDGSYAGYDIDLATRIARRMGYRTKDIRFVPVNSENRASMLSAGRVDLVIASYTITPERKEAGLVFAGPYYTALRSFLVRKDVPRAYTDAADLIGDNAQVCTVRGSTYERWLTDAGYNLTKRQSSYQLCVDYLLDDRSGIAAVSTDDIILAGYVGQDPQKLQQISNAGGAEGYGVAMVPGEPELKEEVCDALKAIVNGQEWEDMYTEHLASLMGNASAPNRPKLTECEDS
ncbi:serine/threonine-protein kinase [Streptomyces sp. AM 2-1-1]|uniref:serine/threonine-protein kinase n=1 Tax=Streptomyces sp. AM 2-1-1 TaxID=3028709 RepID=UPI0023B9484C|nr:serine/threonine-protein kinase [Streptomyces sp. AM 2-1-1]WEH41220.1 serine/threonine-protein kinase [Streptomyces sp. AM 2-1-1]